MSPVRRLLRSPRRIALAAAAVAVLVYANALGNGFAYDDVHVVVDDPALVEPGALPDRLGESYWPGDAAGDLGLWRPLTTLAFALQRRAVGLDPALFHAVNVALHGVVTAMVTLLASALVPPLSALLAGLLFAVHPVHVEAVANVVGLAEMLAAIPYLGACLLFLRTTTPPADGAETPDAAGDPDDADRAPGPGIRATAVLAALYALAFLAKESAVTLPAALVLLDLARRPVPLAGAGRYLRRRGPLLLVLGLTAAAVLGLRYAAIGSLADPDPPLGARRLTEGPRIWTLGVIWLHYVRLLVLPATLAADYSPDVIPVLTVWTREAVAGAVAALGLLGASLAAWRHVGAGAPSRSSTRRLSPWRLPAFAVVWFLVTVSPVSNVLFVSGVLLAERTLYLPSAGFVVAAGWGLAWLLHRRGTAGRVLVIAAFLLLIGRAWTRTPTWESTERVFLTLAVEHPGSGRAQWMVGDILASRGELGPARHHWARAVSSLDSNPWLLRELGREAVERGDDRLGEFLLRRAWEERPAAVSTARRLALLYQRQGRHAEAATFARRVVARDPDAVPFWHLLAGSLEATGSFEEAIDARRRVIELGEDPWQQWLSLSRLHLTVGDSAAARGTLDEALERAPGPAARTSIEAAWTPVTPPPEGGGAP